ncbi:MAG: RiPP maturation radical SAM C-methyltransferase [Pseudomonadota bacterium]
MPYGADIATGTSGADILLVLMPFASVERPSLALGSLSAGLRDAGLSAATDYPNLRFAETIGLSGYESINASPIFYRVGEWCFAEAAFPGADLDSAGYIAHLSELLDAPGVEEQLLTVRRMAASFVDRTANSILEQRPQIVGCSSVFQQQSASLALLRRIRELDPTVITMLGGGNCEGEMGWVAHQSFDFVDIVVSGEADDLLAPLCKRLLVEGPNLAPDTLPAGVFAPAHRGGDVAQPAEDALFARVETMRSVACPDFDDYFAILDTMAYADHVIPGLPVEAARGCWWGQKHHCKFCGISKSGMVFCAKPAEQMRRELRHLAQRYGIRRFAAADNIVETSYFSTLLPDLAEDGETFHLFFQIKANLKRDQVGLLARAGVRWIQPGIEALDDRMLALLTKGAGAMTNLQLLKWARLNGIWLLWHLLYGAPGEQDEWHVETAEWLPLISHLQPPSAPELTRIRFNRFSPYTEKPDEFGLSLRPSWAYRHTYPHDDAAMAKQAYYFSDTAFDLEELQSARPGVALLNQAIAAWHRGFVQTNGDPLPTMQRDAPILCSSAIPGGLLIEDTRPCRTRALHRVDAAGSRILNACDSARSRKALIKTTSASMPETDMEARLDQLVADGLVLELGGLYLSLVLDEVPKPYPDPQEFPAGVLSATPIPRPRQVQPVHDISLAEFFAS